MSNTLGALQALAATDSTLDLATIADTLDANAANYGITDDDQLEAFLANAAEETNGFRTLTEYASGKAYEGRADLGNTQPGDGVLFKGRGIFQITGRSNYADVSDALFGDDTLISNPALLATAQYATLSALYYWQRQNLSAYVDNDDFSGLVKAINGGLNGWKTRLGYLDKAKLFFQSVPVDVQGAIITFGGVGVATVVIVAFIYIVRSATKKLTIK